MGMIQLKTAKELELMEQACRLSNAALWSVENYMQEGITTMELDHIMNKFITQAGGTASFYKLYDFPEHACISVNDEVIHGIPSSRVKLKDGDVVSIDVGAHLNGFHGDNAYTFMVGNVKDETKKLLEVTKEALNRGIEQAVAGNRVGDISHAVQTYAESFGFAVVREYVGHGVGKEVHEAPEIPNFGAAGRGPRLVPGMVIAIEPMINLKGAAVRQLPNKWTIVTASGSPSAHFEHTIAITENGPKILTVH